MADRPGAVRELAGGVAGALVAGVRLLVSNWRLAVLELVPALWITAVVGAAVAALQRWEQGVVVRGERISLHTFGLDDVVTVGGFALGGSLVFLCNTVFARAAVDPEGPEVVRAAHAVRRSPRTVAAALAWGAVAGLLRMIDLVVPLPSDRWAVLVQITAVVTLELVLFVGVPARLVGLTVHGLSLGQRATLGVVTVVLSVVAVVPALVVGRLSTELIGRDAYRPLGVLLFFVALVLQIAGVVVVKAVALAAKLLGRTTGDDELEQVL